jgi:DNA-binding YbaB/EbfC family protein
MQKGALAGLLKQAQKMQEQIQKVQDELGDIKVEGSAGGGMVTVTANAKQELLQIKIDPEVVDPNDVEMLEDLIIAAANQALERGQEAAKVRMEEVSGSMLPNLPPGIKIPGL